MSGRWSTQTLAQACEIRPPKSEANEKLSGGDFVSFLPMEDLGIDQKSVVATQTRRLSEVNGSYTYFANGDVLLAKITPCFENGKLGIAANLTNGIGFGSSEYIVFRPRAVLDRDWLYYFLSQDAFRKKGELRMGGAVGHKRVAKEFIEFCPIPLPPITEQRRIVRVLEEALGGIVTAKANAEKAAQNGRELFESELERCFLPGSRGLVTEPIGAFCEIKHGYAFDGKDFSPRVPTGNPIVITPGNFTEDGELLFNETNTKRFKGASLPDFLFARGDLVVVMTDLSSKMKILGKPAFVNADNVLHNQRIGRVVFRSDRLEKRLLYFFMQTAEFLNRIKGSATGTMVKHTAPKRILNCRIRFPTDKSQQIAIISRLDSLRRETYQLRSVYEQKLRELANLRGSLLAAAFAGHL